MRTIRLLFACTLLAAVASAQVANKLARDYSCAAASAVGTDSYACALLVAPATYASVQGKPVRFTADVANTGAATLNLNGLGAIPIKTPAGGITTDLPDNEIRPGEIVTVIYDGANFQLQSKSGVAPSSSPFLTPGCTFDNGLSAIALNSICYARVRNACTLSTSYSILALGSSPTATVDVFRVATGSLLPLASIISSSFPALITGNAVVGNTVWTTSAVAADDMLAFKITAVSNATWLSIQLDCQAN